MNSKSVFIEPTLHQNDEGGDPCSLINREFISNKKINRVALEFLTIIDRENLSYGAAESALERAKELLDNMKVTNADYVKRYYEKDFDGYKEWEKVKEEE